MTTQQPEIQEVILEEEPAVAPTHDVGETEWRASSINREEPSWIKRKWRPAIAWQYVAVCLFDFIIGPIMTMAFFRETGMVYAQWQPLTLQGGGLYHISMGAIIGVVAWSRGQEKLKGIEI